MTVNLSELDDFQFRDAWFNLADADKAGIPAPDRFHYIERYRELTSYVEGARERVTRGGNGEDIEALTEARESVMGVSAPHIVPPEDAPSTNVPKHNYLQWQALAGLEPPKFNWLLDHWLSWHPTLLAGRGGIGKSLLAQQLGTALACGLPTGCAAAEPVRVLYWACEDDHDQLWRRQDMICRSLKIGFDALTNWHVDARYGLENTLLTTEFGRPMWAPQIELLREQVGDWRADVLLLDNIGHTFGANENVRHDVTLFLNGIAGLVTDRPFCPIMLGHPSKSPDSQYSGSTAWENAVRMRWYLDDKLPDAQADSDAPPDPDYRVLAKKKTTSTRLDYVQLRFSEGILVPEQIEQGEPGIMDSIRKAQSLRIIINAAAKLAGMGMRMTDGNTSAQFLPKLALDYKLGEGRTKRELADAMRAAIMGGKLTKGVVGKYPNRSPMEGLLVNSNIP